MVKENTIIITITIQRRGIFQVDILSSLLFILSMIALNEVITKKTWKLKIKGAPFTIHWKIETVSKRWQSIWFFLGKINQNPFLFIKLNVGQS